MEVGVLIEGERGVRGLGGAERVTWVRVVAGGLMGKEGEGELRVCLRVHEIGFAVVIKSHKIVSRTAG